MKYPGRLWAARWQADPRGGFERMFRVIRLWAGAVLVAGLIGAGAGAQTLEQALVEAYNNNPTLRAKRAAQRATDESVSQARAGWRPTVLLSGSAAQRRTDSSPGRTVTTTPLSLGVSLSQPIYRGGRTVNGTQRAEFDVLAGRAQLQAVEQRILRGTVAAYVDVLRGQAVVQLNQNNVAVLQRQLDATRDRFEVGEVTRTDVSQAEARLSRAESDLIQSQGDLEISRADFANFVGAPPADLQRVPALAGLPQTQEEAIEIALSRNPILTAANNSEQASGFAVRVARGTLLPTVSVVGDLTHSEEATISGLESDTASLTARISVPLYQSGSEYSQVRQLRQTNNQRRIEVEESRRAVIEEVTQAWERLHTASSRIRSRADQVAAAEIALDGVRQEAEVGSRTVLDVLDAEQELLDARVALVATERDEYVAGFDLRAAIGRLTAEDLGLPVDLYNPAEYYDAVRNKLIGANVDSQ